LSVGDTWTIEIEHDSDSATEFWTIHNRCDCHLFVAGNFESLRIRCGRNQKATVAERMPISFQARKAKRAIGPSTVLQDFARGCFDRSEKLDARPH